MPLTTQWTIHFTMLYTLSPIPIITFHKNEKKIQIILGLLSIKLRLKLLASLVFDKIMIWYSFFLVQIIPIWMSTSLVTCHFKTSICLSMSNWTTLQTFTSISTRKTQNYCSIGFSNCFPQLELEKGETKDQLHLHTKK